MAALRMIVERAPGDPALETAISRALLERVAAGELPETVRISRPAAAVAFGRRDVVAPGYRDAVEAARARGFDAIERLAGGRAAVFHEGTIFVAHSTRERDPKRGVTPRFDATAELMAAAFGQLGIDARVGEVEGEYCPGDHSVNVRGERKLMGVGQRVVKGGIHVGGVVVVDGAERVNEVLTPVYAALGLGWRPEATGSLTDAAPRAVSWNAAVEAITAEYRARADLVESELDDATLALARRLAPEHRSPAAVV
jgi:lipoate-protein ligase A